MTEPITESEARAHLRADTDDPYISELPGKITAARQHVEQLLNASIVTQTRTLILDKFPPWSIKLPDGPVTGITSISYVDTDGVTQTVDSHTRSKDVITPAYDEVWPDTRAQIGAVTITYTAGMMTGSPSTLANADIIAAIKLVLTDLWDNRAAQIVGVSFSVNPAVDRLLSKHVRDMGI